MKTLTRSKASCTVIMLFISAASFAQVNAGKQPRIYLYPELFVPTIETTVRMDPGIYSEFLGEGTTLNLEEELGFDRTAKQFRLRGMLGSNSAFEFSYMNIRRTGNAFLERDITFGDTVYHAGAFTNAYFNSKIYGATWKFALFSNDVVTAGLSLGARWLQVEAGIELTAEGVSYKEDKGAEFPVFMPGIHGSVYLTPRLLTRLSLEYLHLHISNFDATSADYRLSVEYYLLKNFGIGAGYSFTKFNITDLPLNKDFAGEVIYSLRGFGVYAAIRF